MDYFPLILIMKLDIHFINLYFSTHPPSDIYQYWIILSFYFGPTFLEILDKKCRGKTLKARNPYFHIYFEKKPFHLKNFKSNNSLLFTSRREVYKQGCLSVCPSVRPSQKTMKVLSLHVFQKKIFLPPPAWDLKKLASFWFICENTY